MARRAGFLLLSILLLAACGGDDDPLARGRAFSDWSSPKAMAALIGASDDALKAELSKAGDAEALARTFGGQLGAERQVFDELAVSLNGHAMYSRLSAYERAPAALSTVVFDAEGRVVSASVQPAPVPGAEPDPAPPATPLSLAFSTPRQGEWAVYWGGRNAARNYHVVHPAQRFAYDFLVVKNGRSFEGEASEPQSYFCWGEPVTAPAAGRIVRAADGVPDNRPVGRMNPEALAGNHVVIEHRPGEFSLIGHLMSGSVAVAQGQAVKAGEVLGKCGNSGNSSEPHVHFHLQDGEDLSSARGIPAPFRDIKVDGKRTALAEPVRGQTVAP